MIDIANHKIWKNVSPLKKPGHLVRFFLARNLARIYPRSHFIGITGSVGKTTTTIASLAVLSQKYKTISTSENLDPIFNIPITLLQLRPKVQKVILEMGIEYSGEMELYLTWVKPATALVTKISYAHSEFLGGIEAIQTEKGLLVRQLPKNGFAILNYDDLITRQLANETVGQVIFYGTDPKKCEVFATNVRVSGLRTKFELNYGVERVEISLKLLGRHFVYPALAAAALGVVNNVSLFSIKKALESLSPAIHRLQLLEGIGGFYVLDDTHNSSPSALEEAINLVGELTARRRILVLGEMRELGGYSEKLHRAVARKIYREKGDFVLLGTGETKFLADELIKLGYPPERLESNLTNNQLVNKILTIAQKGDLVLVKGSRAVRLDEVVKRITKVP